MAHFFKKYLNIFTMGISDMLAWRVGFFMVVLGVVLSWLVMLVFWGAVYREGNHIGSFTLQGLMMYYTFGMVFQIIFDYGFIWDIAEALHQGKITDFLVKPVSYLSFQLMKESGARSAALVAFSVPLAGAVWYFYPLIPHTLITWLLIGATLVIGFIIVALMGFIAALMSVFFQNPHVSCSFFFSTSLLLSGRMVPISVMPHWLATIAHYSPFPLVSGVPIELILGTRTGLSLEEIIIAIVWLFVLIIVSRYTWRWAAIKYEAGGI